MIAAALIILAVLVLLPVVLGAIADGIAVESADYKRKGYMHHTETGRPWSPVSGDLYESPQLPWDED